MVLLTLKKGEEPQFLFETSTQASLEDITVEVAQLYNTRLRIQRLIAGEVFIQISFRNLTSLFYFIFLFFHVLRFIYHLT